MSSTWKIANDTGDIALDGFGNFEEIRDKVKLDQDIREFLLFGLDPLIGGRGESVAKNKMAIRSRVKDSIDTLQAIQRTRHDITPEEESIKRVTNIEVDTYNQSRTSFKFVVDVLTEAGDKVSGSGTFAI
jgi:hypothetical protein